LNDLLQHGSGQVRLADARLALRGTSRC
jgi:hypothetical protein